MTFWPVRKGHNPWASSLLDLRPSMKPKSRGGFPYSLALDLAGAFAWADCPSYPSCPNDCTHQYILELSPNHMLCFSDIFSKPSKDSQYDPQWWLSKSWKLLCQLCLMNLAFERRGYVAFQQLGLNQFRWFSPNFFSSNHWRRNPLEDRHRRFSSQTFQLSQTLFCCQCYRRHWRKQE